MLKINIRYVKIYKINSIKNKAEKMINHKGVPWMTLALKIVIVVAAILLIISTGLQESKGNGLAGLVSGSSETFYSKNKTKTKESFLKKLTIFSGIIFVASIVAMNVIS